MGERQWREQMMRAQSRTHLYAQLLRQLPQLHDSALISLVAHAARQDQSYPCCPSLVVRLSIKQQLQRLQLNMMLLLGSVGGEGQLSDLQLARTTDRNCATLRMIFSLISSGREANASVSHGG